MSKDFNIIACVNKKLTLGNGGNLLYHIKNDLANFKRLTENNIVIMGKKTFESLPNRKPLPNRVNIILTHDTSYKVEGAIVVHSLHEVIEMCENPFYKGKKRFIIGGGMIYNQFIVANLVGNIILTEVNDDADGDTIFPQIDMEKYKIYFQTDWIQSDDGLEYRYKFLKTQI